MRTIDPDAPDVAAIKETGNKKVALVTLGKGHKISDVMKKKKVLKDNKNYSKVFVEPQKSLSEQRAEANMRALARATQGVSYKRGRVVEETDERPRQRQRTDRKDKPPDAE